MDREGDHPAAPGRRGRRSRKGRRDGRGSAPSAKRRDRPDPTRGPRSRRRTARTTSSERSTTSSDGEDRDAWQEDVSAFDRLGALGRHADDLMADRAQGRADDRTGRPHADDADAEAPLRVLHPAPSRASRAATTPCHPLLRRLARATDPRVRAARRPAQPPQRRRRGARPPEWIPGLSQRGRPHWEDRLRSHGPWSDRGRLQALTGITEVECEPAVADHQARAGQEAASGDGPRGRRSLALAGIGVSPDPRLHREERPR